MSAIHRKPLQGPQLFPPWLRAPLRPTLIAGQLPLAHGHEYIGEAILERLRHNAHRLPLKGHQHSPNSEKRTIMKRYHLTLGSKRTTVSLDNMVSDLLAIRLGSLPQSPQAHGLVRAWLQQQLNWVNNPRFSRVSHWLRGQAVLFLVDKQLSETYLDWLLEQNLDDL